MSDDALQQVIGKARRLKQLRRAKERVSQLERNCAEHLQSLRSQPGSPNSYACRQALGRRISPAGLTYYAMKNGRVLRRLRILARFVSPASTEPSGGALGQRPVDNETSHPTRAHSQRRLAGRVTHLFRPAVRARLSRMDIRFARTVGRTLATDFSCAV